MTCYQKLIDNESDAPINCFQPDMPPIKFPDFICSSGILFLHYLPLLLFLRRPKRTRLQWMRDMPALTSQQSKQTTEKQSKKEAKKAAKENQPNGNQAPEKRNSVRRKDAQLTKQASSSSSQHPAHSSLEQTNTLDSPPPPAKQPLQQLNVTTLPMGSNLMQPSFPPLHNHFHTLAGHHHFHHHHPPSLLAMQSGAHFHHPTCTLTPQAEQLHHLNAGSQQAIPPLHYGSDAHLMRSLDSNLSGNLISANFDPLNHLLNAGDLATDLSALPTHGCLPAGMLNGEVDQQNENLNHLNLHHNLDAHLEHLGLHRNESNELAADRCSTLPRPMQSAVPPADYASQRANGNAAPATTKQINARQASCESSSSGGFYLTQAAFKATEAIEFIAEHLRNEDEYIQVGGLFTIGGELEASWRGESLTGKWEERPSGFLSRSFAALCARL